jgi:excinuclease ABC subunit C
MRRSRLSEIPGLGQHRQKELLAAFRSIDYIREASPDQLAQVPGIGPHMAQQIYEYFHPSATDDATSIMASDEPTASVGTEAS